MSPQLEAYERAVIATETAGEDHAKAAKLETTLRNSRHGVRAEVVKGLRKLDLGLSQSAAEKQAETHPDYLAHLEAETNATYEKNQAYTRLVASRLRALGKLADMIETTPSLAVAMLASLVQPELVADPENEREQLVGGVPR